MKLSQLLLLATTVFALNSPLLAEELSAEKRADIELLLKTTGALNMGQQFADVAVQSNLKVLKSSRPDIPEQTLSLIATEIRSVIAENLPALIAYIVPIYHKHFSSEEIRQLLQFYNSEIGKKVIRVMPLTIQEGVQAGQKWGESLSPEFRRRIEEKLKQADKK